MASLKVTSRHVDGVLNMAAKAYRQGEKDLARRLLDRLDKETLTPEQAKRRENALRLLAEAEKDQGDAGGS